MIVQERLARIEGLVNERQSVSLTELMDTLGSSESTIRRDLAKLAAQGRVNKVHGGATAVHASYILQDQSFAGRQAIHREEKRAIAAYAASLIGPDDFVFIDGGTTTAYLVDAITQTRATYLTNSLPHAQRLLAKGCRTYVPGGEVKAVTEVLVGAETVNAIRRYHFTVGFWGTNGAELETGFTTPEFTEAAVKQISLEHTVRPYVLADSSKLAQISLITFADFDDATVLCDHIPAEHSAYRAAGNVVEVEQVDEQRRSTSGTDLLTKT